MVAGGASSVRRPEERVEGRLRKGLPAWLATWLGIRTREVWVRRLQDRALGKMVCSTLAAVVGKKEGKNGVLYFTTLFFATI